jgi:hypothetical protein
MSKNPILQIPLRNRSTLKVITFVEKAALVTKIDERMTHSVNDGFLPVLYDETNFVKL